MLSAQFVVDRRRTCIVKVSLPVTIAFCVYAVATAAQPRLNSIPNRTVTSQGASPAAQASYPAPVEGDFTVRDFHFQDGETLPELRLHYRTLGSPHREANGRVNNAVLILHGTGGAGSQFVSNQFGGVLFGPGQLLDSTKYYIILPDGIGHGKSSKPSDGLHAKFPHYGYIDM